MRLKERVAIVTGGARGIGAGIAHCLADEGARVAVLDIDAEEAARTAGGLGGQHLGVGADVSDQASAAAAVDRIAQHYGRLDILVNNAGGGNRQAATANGAPFTRVQQEGWTNRWPSTFAPHSRPPRPRSLTCSGRATPRS